MKVYSPSQTTTYSFCPYAWYLSGLGVRSKVAGQSEYGAIFGDAMAKFHQMYYTERKERGYFEATPDDIVRYTKLAVETVERRVEREQQAGRVFSVDELAGVHAAITTAVEKYVTKDPIPKDWHIAHVELKLEKWGNARPDLVCIRPDGEFVVVDHKWKRKLDNKYRDKEIARYTHSWQQKHYLAGVGDYTGIKVRTYYILLCVAAPKFKCELLPYSVTDEAMDKWYITANEMWSCMDADTYLLEHVDVPPRMNAEHETPFGPCVYSPICLEYDGDYKRASLEFVQIERKKPEPIRGADADAGAVASGPQPDTAVGAAQ